MTLGRFLSLVDEMARMSLRADASRFYLGYLWWIIEPLLFVLVFYVVFDVLMDSQRGDFLVFLMCGKLTFIWFSKTVVLSSKSLVAGKGLIGKIDLPKALFPMAQVQEGLYRQTAVFVLLLGIIVMNGYGVGFVWLWLIPLIMVNYLLIAGASLLGAFLVCLVMDFAPLISLVTIFLLFTSGVFWDVRMLPDPTMTDWVLMVNPLAFLIDGYRQVLMVGVAPDAVHLFAIGAGAGVFCLAMASLYRRQSQFLALRAITS